MIDKQVFRALELSVIETKSSLRDVAKSNIAFAVELKKLLIELESSVDEKIANLENRIDILESVVQP